MLTTGLNAVLGLAFWVAAARLFSADLVGSGAGAISALMLVASAGWVGLQYMLIRYLPVAGSAAARLMFMTYAAATGVAVLVAIGFLAFIARGLDVGFLAASAIAVAGFIAAVAAWVVFSLQDAALTGLRRALWLPAENTAFGAAKLVLLVALAGIASPWAIFAAWTVPTVVLIAIINGLILTRVTPRPRRSASLPPRRGLVRFAAGHHAVALVAAVPDSLVPLLVIDLVSPRANGFYYAAWTVSYSMRLLTVNIANAMTVEGALDQRNVRRLLKDAARLGGWVLIPAVVIGVAGAGPILQLFGGEYGHESSDLLRLLILSVIPFGAISVALAVERLRQRVAPALAIAATSTGITLLLDLLLIPSMGILGAGVGWLAAQVAVAVGALGLLGLRRRQPAAGAPSVGPRPGGRRAA